MGSERATLRRRIRAGLGTCLAVALVAGVVPGGAAELLDGTPGTTAAAPPLTDPRQGVPEQIDGRQFGDPGAGVDLVSEPAADSFGSAQVSHPIDIPPGRLDWHPDVSLAYSSDGGNGWLGLGWGVSVDTATIPGSDAEASIDSISVDTRWGVPRFHPTKETETYQFGGEQLAPVAHHHNPLLDRVGDRVFTKRVEGDFFRILRHGNGPDSYWWEVQDKIGNKYFYGGAPDVLGPDEEFTGAGRRADDAVLSDEGGNVYWWGLKEKWDISSNVVTYSYDKEQDTGVGDGELEGAPTGTELYLKRINYTGSRLRRSLVSAAGEPALPRYGVHDVVFVRDDDLDERRRPDVSIDATNGALDVTADLLRRIDITYTRQPQDPMVEGDLGPPPAYPNLSTKLVRSYVLNYETGPFGKSLLRSVDKTDENGEVMSTNRFDYFDEVPRENGTYSVFGSDETWGTGDDDLFDEFLGVKSGSALGATESIGGDGRLFLGVGIGGKTISAGGGVQLGGSNSESNLEFLDINGDNLPDKVFKDRKCTSVGASVCYRLNMAGPGQSGAVTFGELKPVHGSLSHLSEGMDFSVGGGAEAYGGFASIMYNHTWSFSKQTSYWSDVNADGLPDLVRDGEVQFNHLDANGNIVFSDDSGGTEVPIDQTRTLDPSDVPDLSDAAQEQAGLFPHVDTLRRWLAPFHGRISIDAPVSLAEPDKTADGVRASIQLNGAEIWSADLAAGDGSVHRPELLSDVEVNGGDRLYFRVGSKDNGASDIVEWAPVITYLDRSLDLVDVNGKPVFRYSAAEDFTLAGYPGTFAGAPFDGVVRVEGDVVKSKATSDDVQIRIYRNDALVYCNQIDHDEIGTFALSSASANDCAPDVPAETEFPVTGYHRNDPNDADDDTPSDRIRAEIDVDTNIDPNALTWKPKLFYVSATDEGGQVLETVDENGEPAIDVDLPTAIDIYPNTDSPMPQPDDSPEDDGDNVGVHIFATHELENMKDELGQPVLPTEIVFSIKTRDGRPAFETRFTIPRLHDENGEHLDEFSDNGHCAGSWSGPQDPHVFQIGTNGTAGTPCSIDFGAVDDEDYYYDFTFQDAGVQRFVSTSVTGAGTHSARWWGGARLVGDDVDVFPPAYRGWGYVGYNGDGARATNPVKEDDLVIRPADLPDPDDKPCVDPCGPEDRDDDDFKDPTTGKYYIYTPAAEKGYWRGPKDVDTEGLTAEEIEKLGDLVAGATWGGATRASSSLMGSNEPGAPPPNQIFLPEANAPVIYGESNVDAFGASVAGILGGGAAWANSVGIVDYLDMNADAFPDVVTQNAVTYTDQLGVPDLLVPTDWSEVRKDHIYSTQAGGGGSPSAPKTSSTGDANTSKNAGRPSGALDRKGKGTGGGPKIGGQRSTWKSASPSKTSKTKTSTSKSSSGKGKSASGSKSKGSVKIGGHRGPSKAAKAGKAIGKAIPYIPTIGITGTVAIQKTNSGDQPEQHEPIESDLADLNGDSLPDRVYVDLDGTMRVEWNLGYRFTHDFEWPRGQSLEEGGSGSQSLDVGVGFNVGYFGISGGVSLAVDNDASHVTWADVNGDGLDDRLSVDVDDEDLITQDSDGVSVELNTGTGLASPVPLGNFKQGHVARSESTSLGGGADFTIAIPLPHTLGILSFLINPGFHVVSGNSAPQVDLVDVDGDGLLDTVASDDDASLEVRRNRIGRTNLLKTVHRPLGARFDLEYDRMGNETDFPASAWVLSRVRVDDGHEGDGADTQVTTFEYDDGRTSFAQRQDYGFRTVVEKQHDTANGGVYRSWERTYDNTSYYGRGLLLKEVMKDAAGRPVLTTRNTWRIVDTQSGSLIDDRDPAGSGFPQLVSQVTQWHDGSGAVVRTHEVTHEYDARGNMLRISDLGEKDVPTDDVVAEMHYPDCTTDDNEYGEPNLEYPWTQVADELIVRSGATILQRRESTVPCDYAAVTEVRDHLEPTGDAPAKIAVTTVNYVGVGGQVSEVIGPANLNGQRYGVTYSYHDPDEAGAFVTRTEDTFGLVTSDTYDNRFGRLVETVDPVGAKTTFGYDARNRVTRITGPLEQGAGASITYEYHAEDDDPWALARHVDAANPGTTIDTVRFVDGLEREIQTKEDATLFVGAASNAADRRVVSGQVFYDAFGRSIKEFYPVEEPLTLPAGAFRPELSLRATEITYDVLDRVTKRVEPGPRVTETTYDFTDEPFGYQVLAALKKGPGAAKTRTYSDVRDNIVAVERLHALTDGTQSPLLTRYRYDPLQRLATVTGAGAASTTASYDLMGRRTSVHNPDTGKVEFRYDLASNIIAKITPKLRAANKQISYTYDANRLVGVRYPDNPSNNVTYTYGAPGASGNGAGLITGVEDASRIQRLAYDKLGRVVEDATTMKSRLLKPTNTAQYTFVTRYTHDTWGRLLEMIFPDGEAVAYGYDTGGLPRTVTGRKAVPNQGTVTTEYVKRLEHDAFGNRRFLSYGNGVTTETTYHPDTLRLSDRLVKRDANVLMDLHYTYDPAGNVLTRRDSRPIAPNGQPGGGPSDQTFVYDDLDRLVSATGSYTMNAQNASHPGLAPVPSIRKFTQDITYDALGRVVRKKRTDQIDGFVRIDWGYDLVFEYNSEQPGAPSHVGVNSYVWDANGNMSRRTYDHDPNVFRSVVWDEENRASSITDAYARDTSRTTTYRYDENGELAIRFGPTYESLFVNEDYSVIDGHSKWKHIFVDDLRVATRGQVPGQPEQDPLYLSSDLLGSTNVVTERNGQLFEHSLFYPSGEPWIRERFNTIRDRFLFADSYEDQPTKMDRMQARWYEPREGFFYSTDPIIVGDLDATIEEPRLLDAYGYAFGNPETFVDRTGRWAQPALPYQRSLARRAASKMKSWLESNTAYNDSVAKSGRDSFSARIVALTTTQPESKLSKALDALSPALFEPTLLTNDDGFVTGFKISEYKVERLKGVFKFLKKHQFRRLRKK